MKQKICIHIFKKVGKYINFLKKNQGLAKSECFLKKERKQKNKRKRKIERKRKKKKRK